MKNKSLTRSLAAATLALLLTQPAMAFLTIGESNDITAPNTLELGVEPQIRMSEGSGANVGFFVDSAIRDDLSWRAYLGAGETDLAVTGSIKWVPFPDTESQPAVGFRGDLTLGRESDETFNVVRIAPMVSKRVQTDYVLFTPYLALAGGIMGYKGGSDSIGQLVIGSDILPDKLENVSFNAELGTNLNKTFSYISFNAVFMLDSQKGFRSR